MLKSASTHSCWYNTLTPTLHRNRSWLNLFTVDRVSKNLYTHSCSFNWAYCLKWFWISFLRFFDYNDTRNRRFIACLKLQVHVIKSPFYLIFISFSKHSPFFFTFFPSQNFCIMKQNCLTFIESITDLGRNLLKPISFSKYSKLDFLSKATCGMSLKNRLQ